MEIGSATSALTLAKETLQRLPSTPANLAQAQQVASANCEGVKPPDISDVGCKLDQMG